MNRYQADRVNSLSGIHCAVTEESQAQTRLAKSCFGANPARGIYSCYHIYILRERVILYCKNNVSFDPPGIIAFRPTMKFFGVQIFINIIRIDVITKQTPHDEIIRKSTYVYNEEMRMV